MGWFKRLRNWMDKRKKLARGQHPCRHAKTKDGLCPHWVQYGPGLKVEAHGLHGCCQIRKDKAKMNFAIVYGKLGPNASATDGLKRACKAALQEYKEKYPEEYYEVFGEDESIGYSVRGLD